MGRRTEAAKQVKTAGEEGEGARPWNETEKWAFEAVDAVSSGLAPRELQQCGL